MGFIKEWASQAAGQPAVGYEQSVHYPWAAITHNLDPKPTEPSFAPYDDFFGLAGDDNPFNIAFELYAMREEAGGNIYQHASAFNPDEDIERVDRALREFADAVDRFKPEDDVPNSITLARNQADTLLGQDTIDNAVAAFRDRQRTDHLRSQSDFLVGIWDAGAILATQTYTDLALLEDGFNRTVADFSARLRLAREDQRANIASQIMSISLNHQDRTVMLRQVFVSVAMDVLRYKQTSKQDQIDKDLEYLLAERFWNVSLLQLALNANSAIYGAQLVPRSQTRGERLMAALTGSASLGIQTGQALGSPGAGFAMGGINMLGQMLLQ